MIYKKIVNFLTKAVPRKRVRFTIAKIEITRYIKQFIVFSREFAKLAVKNLCQIRKINFQNLTLNRAWIYVYALIVILAPFSHISVAAAPLMAPVPVQAVVDPRITVLKDFLIKQNSPLAPYAKNFVASADKYGVDWRLLVAISGNESGYGKRYVRGSHNAYGWGGGYIYFKSWEEGIETINRDIYIKYYQRGKRPLTMEQFGKVYSGQPSWPFWVAKIRRLMNTISTHKLASR